MTLVGTLRHVDLEGGAWLLIEANGRKHQLTPKPVGFNSGDQVEVEGEADATAVSFQMAGPILRVRTIRRV